jgi:hypothetical protein
MDEPLAELAAYSCSWHEVPDADLVRLTAAARAAGHRWDAIAADLAPGGRPVHAELGHAAACAGTGCPG